MLKELLASGYGNGEMDLSCSEKILYGANEVYNLGLSEDALKLSAGFGAGMGIDSVCGALTGAVMVLGRLFVEKNAHASMQVFDLNQELFKKYLAKMGDINCAPLKAKYRTEEEKCNRVILKAAEFLDEMVKREMQTRVSPN